MLYVALMDKVRYPNRSTYTAGLEGLIGNARPIKLAGRKPCSIPLRGLRHATSPRAIALTVHMA